MRLKKRMLAMLAMMAVIVSVVATPATSSAEEQLTAGEYLNMMAAAQAGMTSVRMNVTAVLKEKSGTVTYATDTATSTNPVAMETNTTMTVEEKKGQDFQSSEHSYLVPDAAGTYWEYTDYGEGIGWVKQKADITATDFNTVMSTSAVTEFDASMLSKLKVESDSTMVGDKECVVVTGQITGKTIWKMIGSIDKSLKKEYKALKKCKPIGVTYYIDKATSYPVKMTFALNAFVKSYLKKDKSMKDLRKEFKSVSLEISYSDINAVSVVLPQEALNAVDYDSLYDSIYY